MTEAVAGWPGAQVDPSFWQPVQSEVPVLVVSGAFDPVTPVQQGVEVTRHLPNSLHLVFATGSHDDSAFRPCTDGIFAAFLRSGTVEGLDPARVERQQDAMLDAGKGGTAPGNAPENLKTETRKHKSETDKEVTALNKGSTI